MTHPHDVMTAAELARVVTEVETLLVPMLSPRGKRVMVICDRVPDRQGAGYTLIEEN